MRLTARSPNGTSSSVEIVDGLLIGRDTSCDLSIDDERASRRHAYLTVHADGRVTVQDLGSSNGTFVNGIKIEGAAALQGGEEIRIGNTVIAVEAEPAADGGTVSTGDPHIGVVLNDRYRVEQAISSGGVGVVYLGQDLRLDRKVAIKVLSTQLFQDERSRQRFVNEARVGSLEHPNIIPIYDTDQWGEEPYVVMRYVHGGDLATRLAGQGRLSGDQSIAIIRQIGAALDAAHSRGLVHRDVKPGNVLLTDAQDPEGEGHAFLCDFGIAKNIDGGAALTRPGFAPGTRHYMAPELFRSEEIDGRADLYALGCVLYEALAGLHPYERDSEEALMYAHLQEPIPSLAAVRPDLAWLDPAIAKAMAKDRNQRFATSAEFVAAIEAAKAGGLAPTAPITPVGTATVGDTTPLPSVQPAGTVPDAPAAGAPGELPPQGPPPPPYPQQPASPAQVPPQGPPQYPTAAAPSGGGGGKSKGPILAAIAAVVLVAAVSIYFVAKGGGKEERTSAGPSPTSAATTPSPIETTPSAAPTSAAPTSAAPTTPGPTATGDLSAFTADEQYLLGLLPRGVRSTCVSGGITVTKAAARISCSAQNGAVHVQYNYFTDPNQLVNSYFYFLKKQGLTPEAGDCQVDIFGESSWGDNEGRLFCYRTSGPRQSWIEWMNYSASVYTFAWRDDWNDRDLYQWWRNTTV